MSAPPTPPAQIRVEYVPLDQLLGATRNPKLHNLVGIEASIARFGFVTPAVVDERTGRLVVGHGRTEALRVMRNAALRKREDLRKRAAELHDAGEVDEAVAYAAEADLPPVPPMGVVADEQGQWSVPLLRGWSSRSDAEAEAYLISDNQHTIGAGWDTSELGQMLRGLAMVDPELVGIAGFTDDDVQAMLADDENPEGDGYGDGSDSEAGRGELLSLAGTTVGEPDITCKKGQVWWMGPRHVLVVASPHLGWAQYVPLLEGRAALWPYPSPMAALAEIPDGITRVVMVQPNPYLAGWTVTKWARVTGGTPRLEDGADR